MDTHVKVLGWLYLLLGIFGLLGAACLFVTIAGGGFISGDDTAIRVTLLVSIIIAGFVVVTSIPGVITGIGLLRFRPWARILGLVLGVINLPGFPLGTLLGVYALVVLLNEEVNPYFNLPTSSPIAPSSTEDAGA